MNAAVEHELNEIRFMPYGAARTAASEAITRRIEAEGPKELLAAALLDLVETYSFSDEGVKSFAAFARVLRLWDESPELFDESDERNLFWEFKWVAGDLAEYPQITLAQATAFLNDMEHRFEVAGHGVSSVRMSRFRWAWHTGHPDTDALRLEWITGLRDEFEDCRACTIGQQVDYFTASARYGEAVELGLTQDSSCNIEPTRTWYGVALAALLDGDPELALSMHKRALATDSGGPTEFASARGYGFEMLARGGRLEQALRLLRNDYPAALTKGESPAYHLRFYLGILAGLSANLDRGEDPTGFRETEWNTVSALHAWVLHAAQRIAQALDQRNGNSMFARLIDQALTATRVEKPLTDPPTNATIDAATDAHPEMTTAAPSASNTPETDTSAAASTKAADALLATADTHASRQSFEDATRLYAEAAKILESEGWIERSGLALAEAAQCAALDGEDDASHALFGAAVPRLRTGGNSTGALSAVLTAWAPIATRMNDLMTHLRVIQEELQSHGQFEAAGLSEGLAARRRTEWLLERAMLRDTFARSLASAAPEQRPAGFGLEQAAAEAATAAEEFAQLGRIADASHAFWLAGKVQLECGQSIEALWAFESAFEGFTVARKGDERAHVASELIDLLRQTGQAERADEIVEQL